MYMYIYIYTHIHANKLPFSRMNRSQCAEPRKCASGKYSRELVFGADYYHRQGKSGAS